MSLNNVFSPIFRHFRPKLPIVYPLSVADNSVTNILATDIFYVNDKKRDYES